MNTDKEIQIGQIYLCHSDGLRYRLTSECKRGLTLRLLEGQKTDYTWNCRQVSRRQLGNGFVRMIPNPNCLC